jgi:hypothetical protein
VTVEPTRRLTLREAAEVLGVSKEAVRKRALRGTLRSERDPDGRVYVYVDAGQDEPPTHEPNALISHLIDEVAYLREENQRKDEIIMRQAMTVQALTAGSESDARESPVSPGPSDTAETTTDASGGQQTPTERPWWRRIFES